MTQGPFIFIKRAIVLITMVSFYLLANGQIVINEFSASNGMLIEDPDFHEYPDWLELYNQGSVAQNLNGYYITDNLSIPWKWQITDTVFIDAGGYLLIWVDGRDTGIHAGFRLSVLSEEIGLYSPDFILLDSVTFSEHKTDISFGRKTDGDSEWGFFQEPTPNASNSTVSYDDFISSVPDFSQRGGIYSGGLSVELLTNTDGEIRYTSDGSEPVLSSSLYSSSIPVSSTTILRARIFKPGMIPGPTVTQSYFINENSIEGKLPLISIATAPGNFWDPAEGIYVQDFKPLWEVPVNVELFENNGSDRAAFNELAGAKINGLHSWQLPQKMLGIYFKKQYGTSNLDYPIIHQRERNSYKSFALRASGSDWSYTLFRDILGQHATLLNMDIDIIGFRPAVVFVNGEYLGIHNIREKVDDDYIEKSYNLEPGSFDLVENENFAEAGDLSAYKHLSTLLKRDLSIDSNYFAVTEIVDIENFTDYVIAEMATGNRSITHNVMAWKPKETGKWKWVLMDLDRGFFDQNLISFYIARDQLILKELLRNQSYKTYFAKRLTAQLYTSFHPERMKQLIYGHMRDIEAEIPRHINRWHGTTSSYGDAMPSEHYWRDEIDNLITYTQDRPYLLVNDLQSYGFGSIANLSLATSPANAGIIKLYDLVVPESFCTGPVLKDISVKLEAENKPGYDFVGWAKSLKKIIIPRESVWKYFDSGTDLGSSWISLSYNDDSWPSGKGQLGYGDGDEGTVINYGGDPQNKFITSYFRKVFTIYEEEIESAQFIFSLLKDDGAIVYLNGVEIARVNMTLSNVDYQTPAVSQASGLSESIYNSYILDRSYIHAGENILAVEIHQNDKTSSDISFDLELCSYSSSDDLVISGNKLYTTTLLEDLFLTAVYKRNSSCIIPETISQDLTLSIDCSPYLAQGDITINENATLTVEPGVEIWMPENANIFSYGTIHAVGSSEAGILIKLNPDYEPGSWGVMSFRNTSQASILKHLTIENASRGPDPVLDRGAISAFHSDLILDNITIENISGNPISARYSDITLTNSRLHSEVTGDLINVKYGKARIENCCFIGNDQPDTDGIDYDEIENGIIRNCQIYSFRGFNSDAIDIGEKATNVLIDSIFVYNITDKGVSVGQKSSATVQNSIFINCNMGIAVKDSGQVIVDRCVFYSNVDAVASFEKNLGHEGGNAIIRNSILSNSSNGPLRADLKSTLDINYSLTDNIISPYHSYNVTGNPLFVNPSFFNFGLLPGSPGIQAGLEDGISIDIGTQLPVPDIEPSVMIYQIFINAGNMYLPEFITLYNPSSEKVDLSNYSITKGITVTIPEGTLLDAEDILYLTIDAGASTWQWKQKQVLQWESGRLSNNGEAIQLEESHGIVIDYLVYENDGLWPAGGFSYNGVFQLISPGLDNHLPESWKVEPAENIISTNVSDNPPALTIFPNPTRDFITIKGPDYKNQYATIYNLHGQMIGKIMLNESGVATVDLSAYDSGILLIKVGENFQKVVLIR